MKTLAMPNSEYIVLSLLWFTTLILCTLAKTLEQTASPTPSGCDSETCSAIYTLDGPWGEGQTRNIHQACDLYVPEEADPSTLYVSLSLTRTTSDVQPYTLSLVNSLADGVGYTFVNTWVIPTGDFNFDFQLTYDIDLGDTTAPSGFCSFTIENGTATSTTPTPTTTTSTTTTSTTTTPTTTTPTTTTSTTPTPTTTTSTTTTPTTTTPTTTTSTTPTPTTTTSTTTTSTTTTPTTTTPTTTTATSTTTTTPTTTTTTPTTATQTTSTTTTDTAPTTQSTTTSTTTTSTTTTPAQTTTSSSLLMVISSTFAVPIVTTTITPIGDDGGNQGNIFDNVTRGSAASIALIAGLGSGGLALLASLGCCVYKCINKPGAIRAWSDDDDIKERSNVTTTAIRPLPPPDI